MFLKKIKAVSQTISFRLTAGFSLLFVASSVCVFFLAYGLFFRSLAESDHQLIESKFRSFSALYKRSGVEGIRKVFSEEITREENLNYLVRIQGQSGVSLFLHLPSSSTEFDFGGIEMALNGHDKDRDWLFFPAKYDEDELEIYSAPVGEGVVLQIGKSTDVREDMLERFRDLFSIVLSVSLVVSVLGGMLLANRTLSPVRKLIATIRSIEAGNESARVESKKTGDELDTLTTLFNAMLDRIQRLVLGMRETLDNVAHDLRTPITRFRVIAEMSLQNKQDEQTRREALEEGMEAAEEIQTLLNTLLDISEAESGVMRLNRSEFRLAKLLGEVIDLYELLAEEKNIGITMACPEELTMHADYFRIKRVIANLLDNAIKYTPDGGSVSVEASAEPSWIRIAVQDNGQGMESGEMKRIWDRLYRGDRSRSQRGLGLGLSLVRSIVEAHGGQVSVQSELKGGSRFEVAFPA